MSVPVKNVLNFVLKLVIFLPVIFVHSFGFTEDYDMDSNYVDETIVIDVEGVLNGRVLLPCNVSAPSSTDSPILALFFNENKKTPIYSMDSRGTNIFSASHWTDPDYVGRVSFQVDGGKTQGLLLQKVRATDEGIYICRVDFKASPTRNSKVFLKVIEPPRNLLITSKWKEERVVSKVAGPFPENFAVSLSCQVTGGDPVPQVTWWHEESLIDGVMEIQNKQLTRNTLKLPPLKRDDLLKKLTCQAVNSKLTTPLLSTIQVDLAFPPTKVKILYRKEARTRSESGFRVLVVSEDEQNPLKCLVVGSRPEPIVEWDLDGQSINDKFDLINSPDLFSSPSSATTKLTSTLMFIPQATDKGSLVTCKAINSQLPEQTMYDTVRLDVLYKPRVQLTEGKKINLFDVKEGNDVYFECKVDANPAVNRITWTHNGSVMIHNASAGVLLSSSGTSLILQDVTRNFTGTYTCTARNLKGSTTSNDLFMNVKFVPICSTNNQMTIGGGLKEAVNATCNVLSHPPATHFRWAFNSSRGLHDLSKYPNVNKSSNTLQYNIRSTDDFGAFICWASNNLGDMKDPCVINVIPAAKPESVSGCEISHNGSIPGSRILVQCMEGWDGGLTQTFTLEVRKAAHYNTKVLTAQKQSSKPAFDLSNLQRGEKYLFTILATNDRGESDPVTLFYTIPGEVIAGLTHNARTDPQMVATLQRYLPLIAIILGTAMTLLILILAVSCTIRIRNKRKNDKNKDKSGGDSLGGADSSLQSIVDSDTKEKETMSCHSISRFDDGCSTTLPPTIKSIECLSYVQPPHQYLSNKENQRLLTPLIDEYYKNAGGNTYRRAEDVYHFLPPEGTDSLGRSSTLSSGSPTTTFRSSQSTVVFNPKCSSCDDNKAQKEVSSYPSSTTTNWGTDQEKTIISDRKQLKRMGSL